MKNVRLNNPNFFIILISFIFSIISYVILHISNIYLDENIDKIFMRSLFLASVCLLMFDVLEGAYIAKNFSEKNKNIHFWIFLFYAAYFGAVICLLLIWDTKNVDGPLAFKVALFAIAFVLLAIKFDQPPLLMKYDIQDPITEKRTGALYYFWPLLMTTVIVALAFYPPEGGWTENYLFSQMVLMGTIAPLYPYLKKFSFEESSPKLLGMILLLSCLFIQI